jgi:hypothetical protein
MATVRKLCIDALKRIRVVGATGDAAAEDVAIALDSLNRTLVQMLANGVPLLDVDQTPRTLSQEFFFFVPPETLKGSTLDLATYVGTWDATANNPTLTTGVGTEGYVYRVATAGTTKLDAVSTWVLNDYLIFDGKAWQKGILSSRFDLGVVDMVALDLCATYGKDPHPVLQQSASDFFGNMLGAFLKVDDAVIDSAIRRMPSRRYTGILQA